MLFCVLRPDPNDFYPENSMKLLTIAFILFLILVIAVANLGYGSQYFPFVYYIPWGDKFGHFFLMGMLSFLLNFVTKAPRIRIFSHEFLLVSMIVMLIVTAEEFSQILLEHRGFSLIDLLFDFAGIILFGRLAKFISDRNKKHKS